jgi:chorismate--pyruvate lyase
MVPKDPRPRMSDQTASLQGVCFHKLSAKFWNATTDEDHFFISKEWRFWLLSSGSLTKQLRSLCNTDISIKLLSQKYQRPLLSERKALRNSVYGASFIREVLLCYAHHPIVFARTVCPRHYRHGIWREIQQLDDRPLGDWLFGNHCAIRTNVELARLSSNCLYLKGQLPRGISLWGRRSTFNVRNSSILVTEVFLPNFEVIKSKVNK